MASSGPKAQSKAKMKDTAPTAPEIPGFLSRPKKGATGDTYRGRHTCSDVQWTGEGSDAFATFTLTAEELAGAAESGLIWTDQDVQRGIVPGLPQAPPKELNLADGYPNWSLDIFK